MIVYQLELKSKFGLMCEVMTDDFNITHFDEYAHDISNRAAFLSEQDNRPPMCFSLIASK